MHRYQQPGVPEGTPAVDVMEQSLSVGADSVDDAVSRSETVVFEKYDELLHGGVTTSSGKGANKKKQVLSIAFIKKYVQYAKNRCKPVLTRAAADHIVAVYTGLRNDDLASNQKRTSPLTARTLETLIRLSTAHAKARLSNEVNEQDAMAAEEILRFALFKEVVRAKSKSRKNKKRKLDGVRATRSGSASDSEASGSDEEEDEDEDEQSETEAEAAASKRMPMPEKDRAARYAKRAGTDSVVGTQVDDSGVQMGDTTRGSQEPSSSSINTRSPHATGRTISARADSPMLDTQDQGTETQAETQEERGGAPTPGTGNKAAILSAAREKLFRQRMAAALRGKFAEYEAIPKEELLPELNEGLPIEDLFDSAEADLAFNAMHEKNEIFCSGDDMVYRI